MNGALGCRHPIAIALPAQKRNGVPGRTPGTHPGDPDPLPLLIDRTVSHEDAIKAWTRALAGFTDATCIEIEAAAPRQQGTAHASAPGRSGSFSTHMRPWTGRASRAAGQPPSAPAECEGMPGTYAGAPQARTPPPQPADAVSGTAPSRPVARRSAVPARRTPSPPAGDTGAPAGRRRRPPVTASRSLMKSVDSVDGRPADGA